MARSRKTTDAKAETQQQGTGKPKREMRAIPSNKLPIQPRTMMLPRPVTFFCEPNPPKHVLDAQEANDFDKLHQVDPHRASSCAAVMPNLELLRETGNPYPSTPEHETVITRKKWFKYVPLSHAVYSIMAEAGEPKTAADIVQEAVNLAGVGLKRDGKDVSNDAVYVVNDTLRDLRLYGIATSDEPTAFFKKTQYQLVERPEAIEQA